METYRQRWNWEITESLDSARLKRKKMRVRIYIYIYIDVFQSIVRIRRYYSFGIELFLVISYQYFLFILAVHLTRFCQWSRCRCQSSQFLIKLDQMQSLVPLQIIKPKLRTTVNFRARVNEDNVQFAPEQQENDSKVPWNFQVIITRQLDVSVIKARFFGVDSLNCLAVSSRW